MFECRGCQSKDNEIDHLRASISALFDQLERAQARVMELAEPGVNRRMNPPANQPQRRPQAHELRPELPGYEPRLEAILEVDDTP